MIVLGRIVFLDGSGLDPAFLDGSDLDPVFLDGLDPDPGLLTIEIWIRIFSGVDPVPANLKTDTRPRFISSKPSLHRVCFPYRKFETTIMLFHFLSFTLNPRRETRSFNE